MEDAGFPTGGAGLRHGRHRLRVNYTPLDYSGDRNVSRTIQFGGREYTVGTRVVSDLEARHLQLSWSCQFLDLHDGWFRLGPLVKIDGFPTLGALMTLHPHRAVEIYGRMAGMTIGDYGSFVGSDAGMKVRPWKHLVLTAGYRTFNLNGSHHAALLSSR